MDAKRLLDLRGRALGVATVATVLALASVWHAAEPTWRKLGADRETFSSYSATDRFYAASEQAGFLGSLFDLFLLHVRPGDRIYFQVPRTAYGTLDLHDTIAALGRFYFLPAVEVTDLKRATVVISYNADPQRLQRRPTEQFQVGAETFVSRLAEP